MNWTRVNNDINGNPRYVVHFLECEPKSWKDYTVDLSTRYARTVKLMSQVGLWGRKFHNKQYGGGIVFSTYSLETLEQRIKEAKKKEDERTKPKYFGIDVETHDKRKLIRKLRRLKSVETAEDGGMYREDSGYSQVHVVTTMTEEELDKWLCDSSNCDFVGIFAMKEADKS